MRGSCYYHRAQAQTAEAWREDSDKLEVSPKSPSHLTVIERVQHTRLDSETGMMVKVVDKEPFECYKSQV